MCTGLTLTVKTDLLKNFTKFMKHINKMSEFEEYRKACILIMYQAELEY